MTRVACVQFGARRGEALSEFARRAAEMVASAAAAGAELVVFPAHVGLAYLCASRPEARLFLGPGLAPAVTRAYVSSPRSTQASFVNMFGELARSHRVYVAPGTIPVPSAGGIRNVAHVLSPEGEVIGAQAQTHLCRDERASGFVRADDLRVFDTPLGRIGFAVCEDAWYPEVVRILALQGAQMVIAPVAVPRPYGEWHQVRGMWQNVQQNQVFGIEACLVGMLGGVEFEGRSTIYATCEMTEGDTGVLARAPRTDAEEVLVSELSLASLRATSDRFAIFNHFNVGLYGQWLPQLYRDHATGERRSKPAARAAASSSGGREAPLTSPSAGARSPARRSLRIGRRVGAGAARLAGGVRTLALGVYLRYASRPSAIRRVLARKHITHSAACAGLDPAARPSRIRAAAVQMRLELIKDAGTYARKIYGLVKTSVDLGAQLVVFPEDSATPLVGLMPGIERLAAGGIDAAVARMAGGDTKVADVFRAISPAVKRIYETTFSTLAGAFQVYIIAGSAFLEDDDGKMRIIGYFYGPDGELLARQRKLHLLPLEAAWGFDPGTQLEVLDTPLGRIAFPICMDATYFETFRIARLRGADIVVVPSANNEEFSLWRTMRGIWPRVQESQVLGVSAAAVGNLLGISFTGRSGLLAPLEMTPGGDGFLARARIHDEEEIVVGDLDLDALHRLRDENPLDFNVRLYEKHFPALYSEVAEGSRRHSRYSVSG